MATDISAYSTTKTQIYNSLKLRINYGRNRSNKQFLLTGTVSVNFVIIDNMNKANVCELQCSVQYAAVTQMCDTFNSHNFTVFTELPIITDFEILSSLQINKK